MSRRRTSPSFPSDPDKRPPDGGEELVPLSTPALPDVLPLVDLIERLGTLSTADPRVVLGQPLAQVVQATLDAACDSAHSRRAYEIAIALFLDFLDSTRGERLPAPYAQAWRPFVEGSLDGRRRQWHYRPPALILRLLVDASSLDGFRQARLAAGDSPNTLNQREYALRTFLAVAFRDHILTPEQAQTMDVRVFRPRRKQVRTPVGRRLAPAEVRALRAAVDTTSNKGKRDLLLLDLMLFLGLRREEVCTLQVSDFVLDRGRWWVSLLGKGRQERKLKLPDTLLRSLHAWVEVAGLTLGVEEGSLFCSVNKGDRIVMKSPLSPSAASRLVAEYGYRARLAPMNGPSRLAPHDLRRTAARTAYDQGASLLQVQQMLGHARSDITERYIGTLSDSDDTATDHIEY